MIFRQLFDPETSTYSYLLGDAESREAVRIDSVRGQIKRDRTLLRELDLADPRKLDIALAANLRSGLPLEPCPKWAIPM